MLPGFYPSRLEFFARLPVLPISLERLIAIALVAMAARPFVYGYFSFSNTPDYSDRVRSPHNFCVVHLLWLAYGATDILEFELRGEQGALLFSSLRPDNIEVYQHGALQKEVHFCGNQYAETMFPSKYCPSGWLRALVHAMYLFFTAVDDPLRPSLEHGLSVQRLLNEFTEKL